MTDEDSRVESASILAVIVNYRTSDLTLRSLSTLLREMQDFPNGHVVVVDNDSGDGSFEALAEAVCTKGVGDRVTVIQSGHNGGFAYGVNAGIRAARNSPDAVYLLNSDAFPDPGALRELVRFQRENPQAAIAGGYIHGTDGEPHCTSFRFPTLPGELIANLRMRILKPLERWEVAIPYPSEPQRVDWLAGASMLIKWEVLDEIGLFDDDYFLYFEETDFCRRAADAGYFTWYVPYSSVAHVGSSSTGFQDISKPRARYWFESRRRYYLSHHGPLYLQVTNVVWVLSYVLWRLRRRLKKLPDPDPPRLLRDFIRYSFLTQSKPG